MDSNFKKGDKVVIIEAFPDDHNGKVASYIRETGKGHDVFVDEHFSWYCCKIRHATLLEKELAEV